MKHVLRINHNDNVGILIEECELEQQRNLPSGDWHMEKTLFFKGDRIALKDIKDGEPLLQYGYPFAVSKGILIGEKVTPDNTSDYRKEQDRFLYSDSEHKSYLGNITYQEQNTSEVFYGYYRRDGNVGTRNYYIILPLSQCASDVAVKIASGFSGKKISGLDGIIPLPNTEGCGCTRHIQIERFLSVIFGFISHPNVCRILAVELGCEQTNENRIREYMQESGRSEYLDKVDFVSIEGLGGTKKTICEGIRMVERWIGKVSNEKRKPAGIDKLILGTECGGSNSFSGITANRLIGEVSDFVVDNKGSVILSEIPEMIGAERIILQRCASKKVAEKFRDIICWYEHIADALNESISDNLVQENINGGLMNPTIKSLGAIVKGGTRPIVDVLEYAEKLHTKGLNIMQGPGNDIESVTGMTAAGANMICFSTGKGTTTGAAIVPVIKVASTRDIFEKMKDDMDCDGECMLNQTRLEHHIREFTETLLRVASGEPTKSEINDQHQFQVWTAGKLSV